MNESLSCECASVWGDAMPSGTPVCPPSKAGMFESWSHGVSELEERAGVTLWSCLLCPKAITEFMAPATPDQAVHHLLPGLWLSGLIWSKCQRLWAARIGSSGSLGLWLNPGLLFLLKLSPLRAPPD